MANSSPGERVERFGLVGAGAIGSGLARLLSGLGVPTTVVASRPGGVARATARIRQWYASDVRHGRLSSAEADAHVANLRVTSRFADLADATFVIESVAEDLRVKREVLDAVERHTAPDCVVASNTSSIPLAEIAARAGRPCRVIGMHFFWPAHRYRLVEIARAHGTGEDTLRRALGAAHWMGKLPLLVRDRPGFFTTRVLLAYLNEAVALVHEGASVDAVDGAMQAFGWAMGPFRLLDAVGLEKFREIQQWVAGAAGDRVADVAHLWPVVDAGHTGLGNRGAEVKGFYRYPGGAEVDARVYPLMGRNGSAGPTQLEISLRPIWQLLNEVGHCLAEGVVASLNDADLGVLLGLGWPSAQGSPLTYARRVGVAHLVEQLMTWAQQYGPRFTPSPMLCSW